jgi:hypothetical protein
MLAAACRPIQGISDAGPSALVNVTALGIHAMGCMESEKPSPRVRPQAEEFSADAIPSEIARICDGPQMNVMMVAHGAPADQVKSDPRHPVWCSTEQVARVWEMLHAREAVLAQWVDGTLTPQPNASSMGWGALGGVRRHPRQKETGCDGCVTKRRMAPACRPI